MPSIHIYTKPLDKTVRDRAALAAHTACRSVIKGPALEQVFHEQNAIYVNGLPATKNEVSVFVEGPELGKENTAELTRNLYAALTEAFGDPGMHFTVVYHVNDHDHVAPDGVLLSERLHK